MHPATTHRYFKGWSAHQSLAQMTARFIRFCQKMLDLQPYCLCLLLDLYNYMLRGILLIGSLGPVSL